MRCRCESVGRAGAQRHRCEHRQCREYATHFGDEQLGERAFEAVLRDLAVMGEAVRALSDETKDAMPQVPWPAIAGLRNVVIHRVSARQRAGAVSSASAFAKIWDGR